MSPQRRRPAIVNTVPHSPTRADFPTTMRLYIEFALRWRIMQIHVHIACVISLQSIWGYVLCMIWRCNDLSSRYVDQITLDTYTLSAQSRRWLSCSFKTLRFIRGTIDVYDDGAT